MVRVDGLGLVRDAVAGAVVELPQPSTKNQSPASNSQWAEACVWPCAAFNKTDTTAGAGKYVDVGALFRVPAAADHDPIAKPRKPH